MVEELGRITGTDVDIINCELEFRDAAKTVFEEAKSARLLNKSTNEHLRCLLSQEGDMTEGII